MSQINLILDDYQLQFREAVTDDLPKIINLLHYDLLGETREALSDNAFIKYQLAFDDISNDKNAHIIVIAQHDQIMAVAQINFLSYLTYQGGKRGQIEGIRVDKNLRGKGLGQILIKYLIKFSIEKKCHLVQLTTNKQRIKAKRFYESLGFTATHEGMKLELNTLDRSKDVLK